MEVTSAMFLSIMILLQNSLPCTENFYRYQKNFEKYISTEDGATTTTEGNGARPGSGGQVKTIASPRFMTNSPLASLAKQHGINFNPSGAQNLLKYAANKPKESGDTATPAGEENKVEGEVNLSAFRTAKQDQAEKKARVEEMQVMIEEGKDQLN